MKLKMDRSAKLIFVSLVIIVIYLSLIPEVIASGPNCNTRPGVSTHYIYWVDHLQSWCSTWVGPWQMQGGSQRAWDDNDNFCEDWFDCGTSNSFGTALCADAGDYQGRCVDACSLDACVLAKNSNYQSSNWGACDRANIECKTYGHYFDGVHYATNCNAFKPEGTLCAGGTKSCTKGLCGVAPDSDAKMCALAVNNNQDDPLVQEYSLEESSTTDPNRCCGNDPSDYGYITTDIINGVTYGKYLCDKDASGWKWKAATDPSSNFKIKNLTNKYYTIANGNSWQVCKPAETSNAPNAFAGVPDEMTFTKSFLSGYLSQSNVDYGVTPGSQFPVVGSSPVLITSSLEGAVSLEQFSNDFSQVIVFPLEETVSASDGVSITILPPSIRRNEPIKLKISGLPVGSQYKILNDTGLGILVKDGNTWKKAYHAPETVSDISGRFGFDDANPFYITVPNDLIEGKHLLNITIVQQTGTPPVTSIYKRYNKTFTVTQPPILTSFEPYYINPEKFFCYNGTNEQGAETQFISYRTGMIAECCGPNYAYCLNKNKNLSRIAGGPTTLIKDYYGSDSRNNVYRRIFSELLQPNIKLIEVKDLAIRNWNIYDNLEFDIFLAGSKKLNISINWTPQSGTPKTKSFDFLVLAYSPSGNELNKWHHIVIPITSEIKSGKVNQISFYVSQKQLTDELGSFDIATYGPGAKPSSCLTSTGCKRINISGNYSLNLVGLDRFFLSNSETKFCASSYDLFRGVSEVGKWINDFDLTGTGAEEACNNVASYGWTGSRCCGDDQGILNEYVFRGITAYVYTAELPETVPIFRIFNPTTGDNRYIPHYSEAGRDNIIANKGYIDKGVVAYSLVSHPGGDIQTIQLGVRYSPPTDERPFGDQIFIAKPEDTAYATSLGYTGSTSWGNIVFTTSQPNALPLYEFYNPKTYDHLYTAEPEEINVLLKAETFNDNNAGCWQGTTARNNTLADNSALLFFNDGTDSIFRACNINTETKTQLEQSSSQVGSVDIDTRSLCTNLGSWYCDSTSKWEYAFKYGITNPINAARDSLLLKSDPKYPAAKSRDNSCCPSSFCFNGTSCENSKDYTSNAKKPPIFKDYEQTGFRCSASGIWKEVSMRKDFFLNDTGYCNENSECYANNKCYPDGNWSIFKGIDRLCYNGDWTTRSKYIANALLRYTQRISVSPNDYTLYCDSLETALGEAASDISYSITSGEAGKSFGDFTPQMNGLCILKYKKLGEGNKIIIGTALYKPISINYPVYEAFGFEESQCDLNFLAGTEDTVKRICSTSESGSLFYSKAKQVMFYSADSSVPIFSINPLQNFLNTITNPLTSIVNLVKKIISSTPHDVEMVNNIKDFNKIFFLQKTSKSLTGIVETKVDQASGDLTTALSLNYTGFTSIDFKSNLCAAVTASLTNSVCNTTKTTSSVVIFDSSDNQNAFDNIWPDLTAKLRVE